MTRFRLVSLCLVTLLCLAVAAPAMANPPYVVPSGFVETINEIIAHVLTWFGAAPPSSWGPEIVPAG